jgi:hypothetical protein
MVLSTYSWVSLSAELVTAICKGIAYTKHLTLDDSALLHIYKDFFFFLNQKIVLNKWASGECPMCHVKDKVLHSLGLIM